jgi:hypothetical protein
MRWPWKRRSAAPVRPEGVRIVRPDGSVIACGVLRNPAGDTQGITAWTAHPLDENYVLAIGDRVEGLLPGGSFLDVGLPLGKWPPNP